MNTKLTSSLLACTLALSACASTNFQQYEGRAGSNVVEGQGGTKESLEGYELWGSGTPPRRYEILGMVEIKDTDNFLGNRRIREALVAQIKQAGGSAAISMDSSGGGQMTGLGFSSGGQVTTTIGFGKKLNRYLIVKYLD